LASPLSPHIDAGVDFYFVVFFLAVFFFAIMSSFSPDIGESEICLEPIIAPDSFLSESPDLFHNLFNARQRRDGGWSLIRKPHIGGISIKALAPDLINDQGSF
jgi:hypothetical protein